MLLQQAHVLFDFPQLVAEYAPDIRSLDQRLSGGWTSAEAGLIGVVRESDHDGAEGQVQGFLYEVVLLHGNEIFEQRDIPFHCRAEERDSAPEHVRWA